MDQVAERRNTARVATRCPLSRVKQQHGVPHQRLCAREDPRPLALAGRLAAAEATGGTEMTLLLLLLLLGVAKEGAREPIVVAARMQQERSQWTPFGAKCHSAAVTRKVSERLVRAVMAEREGDALDAQRPRRAAALASVQTSKHRTSLVDRDAHSRDRFRSVTAIAAAATAADAIAADAAAAQIEPMEGRLVVSTLGRLHTCVSCATRQGSKKVE